MEQGDAVFVIGQGIVRMLRDALVPKHIKDKEQIGRCLPKTRGKRIVGVHLHGMKNYEGTGGYSESNGMSEDRFELHYMISVSSAGDDLEDKSEDADKILGKIAETMNKFSSIPQKYLEGDMFVNINLNQDIDIEQMSKIWAMYGEPYQLSLFYILGPVTLRTFDPQAKALQREKLRAMMPDSQPKGSIDMSDGRYSDMEQ